MHISIDLSFIFIYRLGFQNPNLQGDTQVTGFQSPQSVGFNTQNTQNFVPQSPSWQSKISFSKIHIFSFIG